MTHDSYAALRVPNFRRLILSYATSSAARDAQIVVVGFQVYDITCEMCGGRLQPAD